MRHPTRSVTILALVTALVTALVAGCAGGDTDPANGDPGAAGSEPSCEDIEAFAEQLTDVAIDFDYQPSTGPAELAEWAEVVLSGNLTGEVTPQGDYIGYELDVVEVLAGEADIDDGTVTVTVMYTPSYEPAETYAAAIPIGAPVIAFADLASDVPGGLIAWLPEGFMTGCDGQPPIGWVERYDGWGEMGSLADVEAAVTEPSHGGSTEEEASDEDHAAAGTLAPTAWPEVVVAGEPTEVFLSVAPRGQVDGPVVYEVAGTSGELDDEGGVYATSLELVLSQDAEVVVSATVEGSAVSGAVTVSVAEGGLPALPAPAPTDPVTVGSPDGGEVLADRVVFRTVDGVSEAELIEAADAVSGSVVGRLSASVWQVEIPAVGSWDELAAVLDGLEGQPGLTDVATIGVGELGDGPDG